MLLGMHVYSHFGGELWQRMPVCTLLITCIRHVYDFSMVPRPERRQNHDIVGEIIILGNAAAQLHLTLLKDLLHCLQ